MCLFSDYIVLEINIVVVGVSGYRHVQLRTQHNEPLEVSSLFISSRRTEEGPTGGTTPSSLVRLWLYFTSVLLFLFNSTCSHIFLIPPADHTCLNLYANNVLLSSAALLSTQLFSSEEKHVSQQHRVTVYGAPGPEPFTAFCVTEQTTAKQLLDIVSTLQIKILGISTNLLEALSFKPSLPLQVVGSAGNSLEYFLCEERVPLLKERSEVKRCAQHRALAPEEEVVRLVCSWNTDEGYVGRICLKLRDEVR